MTDQTFPSAAAAPAAAPAATRPIYWSVRRELWENRSLYIAPLAVAGVLLLGFLVGASHLPEQIRAIAVDPTGDSALSTAYDAAAVAIIMTTVLMSALYSLGALHGERRDRSILFWKSLPVSDLTTVGSKALIPLAVLPVIAVAVVMALHLVMLLVSTVILLANGLNPLILWSHVGYVSGLPLLVYGLATNTLWLAPVWAWFLLVSAWAKRTPFLWAVLPPVGLCVLEKMAFGTNYLVHLLGERLTGGFDTAFRQPAASSHSIHAMIGGHQPVMDPLRFLATPGLWLGLIVAAACLAGAVRLRRDREPI